MNRSAGQVLSSRLLTYVRYLTSLLARALRLGPARGGLWAATASCASR
jgi:hypothetical protein